MLDDYTIGCIKESISKLQSLSTIVSKCSIQLEDEVFSSRETDNKEMSSDILLSDALNTCEYAAEDLGNYLSFYHEIIHSMKKLLDKKGTPAS
ncbi:hypothetical protein [Sulfurimonas sp.]